VKVVSNASPLITLARIGQLDLLKSLFPVVSISTQVFEEVAIAGVGRPAASAVSEAKWIEVVPIDHAQMDALSRMNPTLGAGEVSAVILAKQLRADLVLMDEWKGRKLAVEEGLQVVGCIGILEQLHVKGILPDLKLTYSKLLEEGFRIDSRVLQNSLKKFGDLHD
jgi:uncharacterized protein